MSSTPRQSLGESLDMQLRLSGGAELRQGRTCCNCDAQQPPLTPRLLAWLDQHKMGSYEEELRGFGVQGVEDIGYLADIHLMSLGLTTVQLQKLRHLMLEHNKGRRLTGNQIHDSLDIRSSRGPETPGSPCRQKRAQSAMSTVTLALSPSQLNLSLAAAASAHDYHVGTCVEFTEDINIIEYGHWGKQRAVCVARKGEHGVVCAVKLDETPQVSQHHVFNLWGKETVRVQLLETYDDIVIINCEASQIRDIDTLLADDTHWCC